MNKQFRTADLAFAAFLACTRLLPFIRCERSGGNRVNFVFEDPESRGHRLYLEYEGGATTPAAAFHAAVKLLRREIDAARGRKQKGQHSYEHTAYTSRT